MLKTHGFLITNFYFTNYISLNRQVALEKFLIKDNNFNKLQCLYSQTLNTPVSNDWIKDLNGNF